MKTLREAAPSTKSASLRRSVPITMVGTLVGGIAVVVGSFLAWMRSPGGPIGFAGGTVSDSGAGIDFVLGYVTLAAGALAILAGVVSVARRRGRLPSLAGVVAGVVAAAVATFFLLTLETRFIDLAIDQAASRELPGAKIESLLARAFRADIVEIEPGVGLWVTFAGGVCVLLFALLSLMRRGRRANVSSRTQRSAGLPNPPASSWR